MPLTSEHRLVFVAGLHRSGTTPLARALAAHHQVSGFAGTGVPEDEGQHLQSVYPTGRDHGAQGRFALDRRSHLDETSPLATHANAQRLLEQWSPHWDTSRPVLLEKSPPNIVRLRFLQALFPAASFVVVVRHPVVVALGTKKWARTASWTQLLENWFVAHERFLDDAPHIRRLHVLKYEEFVADPAASLDDVGRFLSLDGPVPADSIQPMRSTGYLATWRGWQTSANPLRRRQHARLCGRFAERAARFGYDMLDLDVSTPIAHSTASGRTAP
jgi:hypothetical protein